MPDLNEVFEEYGDQDLVVLGVNTAYTDSRAGALELVDELSLPITFWVDEDGIIRFIKIGAI